MKFPNFLLLTTSTWLKSCPSCMKSCEQQFICDIVGHFTLLFDNRSAPQLIEAHQKLSIRVIQTLQQLFERRGGFLTPQSWDYIIRLMLGAADNLLCRQVSISHPVTLFCSQPHTNRTRREISAPDWLCQCFV